MRYRTPPAQMSEISSHSVVPRLVWLRLCFALAVWAANTWVARAASGKEGSSRSHVMYTTKPAQKSCRPTAPPTPYTNQTRQISGKKNPEGGRSQQKDKGHLVEQLSALFERASANGADSQPPLKRASVHEKGAGAHRGGSGAAAVKSERPTVPGNSVAGRKRTAKLTHCFETGPNNPPQERSASKTKGWEHRKGKEGLHSAAGPTNSSKVTSVHATGRSPLGRLLTTENNSDHSEERPQYASPRAPGIKKGASKQLTDPHFGTSPDERAPATAAGYLKKGCCKVEPTVSKPVSLHCSDRTQCKQQSSVSVAHEAVPDHMDGVAASAGYPAQEPRSARRPQAIVRWFTRRKSGRGRQASRRKSGSSAGWSPRTVSHVCSCAYAPIAFSLLSAGLITKDLFMTVAGSVLLSGGFMLNVLSLLALRFRRLPVIEIIPFTVYNLNLYSSLLPPVYFSTIFLTSYFFVSYCAAFARSGLPDFLRWVAPLTAVVTAMGAFMSIPSVARFCGVLKNSRSRGAAADPESMMSNTEEMDDELAFDFEMFSSHPAEANNSCCEITENTLVAPHCSWISRLARLIRLRLYTLFVTVVGASLSLSQALVRYRESRPSTGSVSPLPVHASREPRFPFPYSSGRVASSPSSASMLVTGYLGVAYMLFAVGSAVFRLFTYRAAHRAQLESSIRRRVIFFDYALTFYPFLLGITMCTLGFLASYVDTTSMPSREFAVTLQYAVALLGVFVILLPTFWVTCQCSGASLRDFLRDYQPRDIRTAETRDTRHLAMSALQDCQIPLEGQHTAALETHDQWSSSEWDTDDDG